MTRLHLPELDAAQDGAIRFALGRQATMFAVGMGGGKTELAVRCADAWQATRMLIMAPKSAVGVWPDDLVKRSERDWTAHRADRALGRNNRPLASATLPRRAAAAGVSYAHAQARGNPFACAVNTEAAWQGDMGKFLASVPWDLLVIDESHRLKSPSGKASKWARKVAAAVRARGGHVLLLTGTPMPHSPLDMWAQAMIIDGGDSLGDSFRLFCARYGKPSTLTIGGRVQTIYKDIREDARDAFAAACAPWTHQITEAEIDQLTGLPPLHTVRRLTTLSPAERRVYDDLEKHLVTDLAGGEIVEAANSMVLLLRLAQISGGYAKTDDGLVPMADPPAKAKLLAEVLDDVPRDAPIVAFGRFHADLDAIRGVAEAAGLRYGELSGRRRDGLAENSTIAAGVQLIGCQLQSGGTGVRFHDAHTAIYYSLDFRLGDYLQSRKRLHRVGQTRPVTLIHLLVEDTIDPVILRALESRGDGVREALLHIQQTQDQNHAFRLAA
jgi:hypothetical protein